MSKHTPGPWRTTKNQPNVICNAGGDKWIARATIGHSRSPRFIADPDIAEANAALIVKAVNAHADLLEALKHLSEVYDHIWVKMTDGEMAIVRGAWELAEAAIAKAEGGDA